MRAGAIASVGTLIMACGPGTSAKRVRPTYVVPTYNMSDRITGTRDGRVREFRPQSIEKGHRMASPRRVGAETSKTRAALLDAAEKVMLDDGYAAVTYRSVASRAGNTAGLVQYYFATLDDLFLALLRRRSEQNHERLLAALESRADDPLRVVWEFSTDETSAALLTEFMALANHRKVIQSAILEVTERTRRTQLEAVRRRWDVYRDSSGGLSPEALLFLLHMIPKMILLEESFGMTLAHDELIEHVRRRLDAVEPARAGAKKATKTKSATKTKGARVDARPPQEPLTATAEGVAPTRQSVVQTYNTLRGRCLVGNDVDSLDFLTDPSLVADPYGYYDALRACPVQREPHHGVVLVSGYDEVVGGVSRRPGHVLGLQRRQRAVSWAAGDADG